MCILIDQMNSILTAWKAQFDIMSSVSLLFSADDRGQLLFNTKPLCLLNDLELDTAQFDAEQIVFDFIDQHQLLLQFIWPEEGTPYVDFVCFKRHFGI